MANFHVKITNIESGDVFETAMTDKYDDEYASASQCMHDIAVDHAITNWDMDIEEIDDLVEQMYSVECIHDSFDHYISQFEGGGYEITRI